jgi:hypothetical protein
MSTTTDETHDLLWGVPAIAAVINKPERSTYPMLERGDLPARKVRGRWATEIAGRPYRRRDASVTVDNRKSEHKKRRATARTVAQRRSRLHVYNRQSRLRAQ